MRHIRPLAPLILFFAAIAIARAASPMQEWKDAKGATFKGEPIEVVGPMALFRTGGISSKFMPMRVLSTEDCVRFYQAIAARAPRAERWSDAKGEATADLAGKLHHSSNQSLRAVDFAVIPEPE